MTATLPSSRDPAVIAVCLEWLHDSLPWPRAPRGFADAPGGFATPAGRTSSESWRQCEQCNGQGATRRGPCTNCDGQGGWHYDPMDERRAALTSSADAHPELDAPVVKARPLSTQTDHALEQRRDEYPPPLRHIVDSLARLRDQDRTQRAIVQRVYVLRIDTRAHLRPAEAELLDDALVALAGLLPERFRAPRWARERAARKETP